MNETPASRIVSDEPSEPGSWQLDLVGQIAMHVPDRLDSPTTYALLEQERWFEREFDFVHRLLPDDANILDIGANHGVYTLSLAARLPRSQVIAFEPTHEPRSRLVRSILDNRLADRVAVAPMGLSDRAGHADIHLSGASELNSLRVSASAAGRVERIELAALDPFLERHRPETRFDFVKLDAEGEELRVIEGGRGFFTRQDPIVMFELSHGTTVQLEVAETFRALGYGIFVLLPGLDILAPWSVQDAAVDRPLNLFAIAGSRAESLAARGLLTRRPAPWGRDVAPLEAGERRQVEAWLAARPWAGATRAVGNTDAGGASDGQDRHALALLASVHADPTLDATVRLQRSAAAVEVLGRATSTLGAAELQRLCAAVHGLHLTGRTSAAFRLARTLLQHWPAEAARQLDATALLPPLAGDLDRACSTDAGSWLRLLLSEYVERVRAFSTFYSPADPTTLRFMLRHPDHGIEIERRYALGEFRQNRAPDLRLLPQLAAGRGTGNRALWEAVLGAALEPQAA